jgi:hypothetical protein
MATATTTPGASRQVRRETCTVHLVQFGQEYIPAKDGQEAYWNPPFCFLCEEEFLRDKKWDAEKEKQVAEIIAERDKRVAADAGRAARITEEANRLMAEDVDRFRLQFYATRRREYEEYATDQDDGRIEQEIIAERRDEFFERARKVG